MARDRILVFVAGALPALTFPELSLWWLGPVVLVPWLVLLALAPSRGEAALRGWLGGAGLVLAVHHWLLPNVHVFTPVVMAVVGLVWAPWGLITYELLRAPRTAARAAGAVVVVPSGWLLVEAVRTWEPLGGAWGLLGAGQWQVAPALALAALGGVWLVSWVLVALNVAVATVVLSHTRAVLTLGAASVTVLAALTMAQTAAWARMPGDAPPGPVLRVAAVQPGVIHRPGPRLARAEALTAELSPGSVDLVVWGESSVGFDLASRPDLRARLARASARLRAPLLVNVDSRRGHGGIAKSAVLVGPRGVVATYDKTRLVPFGEYLPLRGLLGWLTGATDAADEDRHRGRHVTVLRQAPGNVGPLVCFESAFPDMARTLARRGAGLVVVQSATSTFQGSWAPEQHASLAALRAAEAGLPVVHATLSGQTRAFDAHGRSLGRPLGTDESATVVYRVPLSSARTPFVSLGSWAPAVAAAVVAVWAVLSAAVWVRRRSVFGKDVGSRRAGGGEVVHHQHGTGLRPADRHGK